MLELGWSEILVIAIVLIVVVGPKDLPRVLRSFGRTTAKMRTMAGDFRRQFDEALREAELEDVKGLAQDLKKFDPRSEIRKHLTPLEQAGRDIQSGLNEAARPKPLADSTPAADPVPAEPLKNGAANLPGEAPAAVAAAPAVSAPAPDPARKAAARPAAAKKGSPARTAAKVAEKPAPRRKKTAGTAP
ncbi:Sec-independent protein translocase protein TatB [Chelativorans sp.]|uniref:Sec-independent protein translocase protein TatB n=1 Tax=Chelativorans sp. TaxID=2203393 RepID=UPI0028121365|nr:Sec-independent protein translocase protein TatB [Chelativorans sp.]